MAMTPGDNEGGGGSQPFCAISPSDLVGIQENWLSRIEALEKTVSQLLAQNVWTNQLSDISDQIGWITGITYMGVPGWTRTEAGTLIPPPGFTLSNSGFFKMFNSCTGEYENYQGVLTDSDGVLQFGFTEKGNMCGEKVQAWNAAAQLAEPDFAQIVLNEGTRRRGMTVSISQWNSTGGLATVTASQAGLYWVHGECDMYWSTNSQPSLAINMRKNGVQFASTAHNQFYQAFDNRLETSIGRLIELSAGDAVEMQTQQNAGTGTVNGNVLIFSIFRVSSLTGIV